jgi:hypothetical protein
MGNTCRMNSYELEISQKARSNMIGISDLPCEADDRTLVETFTDGVTELRIDTANKHFCCRSLTPPSPATSKYKLIQ